MEMHTLSNEILIGKMVGLKGASKVFLDKVREEVNKPYNLMKNSQNYDVAGGKKD